MSGHPVAEGWYRDPFKEHEDRWISDGKPTKLVRDGGVEASDDPPADQLPGELVPIPEAGSRSPDDLRRADDAESEPPLDDREMVDRATDMIATIWPIS